LPAIDRPRKAQRPGTKGATRHGLLERRSWVVPALVGGLVACATAWSPPEPRTYHRTAAVQDAGELVGADECEDCHEEMRGYAVIPDFHAECESCHGPGELHAESEEPADIRFPGDADCLACHETGRSTHLTYATSEHARSGVLCSDCHDPHNRELRNVREALPVQKAMLRHAGGTTRLCVSCHSEVGAQLALPSHHPIEEGMLGCTDCHQPHEDRRVMLGGRTALCAGCHEDHVGPWIYEHLPGAEDCGYCHEAHGTSAYNLLATSQPGVCIACHSIPDMGATHGTQAFATRCTDCHGAIHGSYTDPLLRR